MNNSNQLNISNEYIFDEEWKKLVKSLFKGKGSVTKSQIIKEMKKAIPNPTNVKTSDVKAFDTDFTWQEIISAIEYLGSTIQIKSLYSELKKICLDDEQQN